MLGWVRFCRGGKTFQPDPVAGGVAGDGTLPGRVGQSGGFCDSGGRVGSVSQFFRSRRNSAARKAAVLTMMPAAVIAASQAWEVFLRGCAIGGRSRLQH